LTNKVLPVPGNPSNNTPFGIFAFAFLYLEGSFRKSTISTNSIFASSHPATSLNKIFVLVYW